MSYRLVDLCFHIPGLKLGEQAVLMAICKHADNKTHDCYPSRDVIAGFARLDERQVQRLIPILVEKGLITRTVGGKGRATRSQYVVQVDYIKTLISKGDIDSPLLDQPEDENESLQGDNTPPIDTELRETFAPSLGDIDDTLRETFTHSKGDIECSLYKKNLSVIGQSIGQLIGQEQSVKAHALSTSRSLSLAVNPEASADLSEIATRIAVAHPRNMLKHITALEVPTRDLQAIVEAILLEAGKGDVTEVEAGEMLLRMVEELQAAVPRGEWHFLKPVTAYFAEFEYRRDPETFKRSTGARGGASNGKRRGTDGNAEALREFLAGSGDAGERNQQLLGATGGGVREADDRLNLPPLHGGDGGVHAGADRPGVLASVGGVQGILPKPSYPPRVQWPRRNG